MREVIALLLLTLMLCLLAFSIRTPWREAILIFAVLLLALLWLNWANVVALNHRWV